MKASMQKQYGAEKGKQVYFAYIRKQAMKNEQADTHIKMPSGGVGDTGRV
jgi:heat shock protein HspQ